MCRKSPGGWQSSRGKAGRIGFYTCRARRRFSRRSRQEWMGFGGSLTGKLAGPRRLGTQAPTAEAVAGAMSCAGSVCSWRNPANRRWTGRMCGASREHRRSVNGTSPLHACTRIQVIAVYVIFDLFVDLDRISKSQIKDAYRHGLPHSLPSVSPKSERLHVFFMPICLSSPSIPICSTFMP